MQATSAFVRMKKVVLALMLCWACAAVLGHQDRRLALRADGSIAELPGQYSATRLFVSYLGGYPPGVIDLTIQSGGRENVVPECLLKLLQPIAPEDLEISGSWYHDEALLPHYVNIHFKGNSSLPKPVGVDLLFSLRDARLLEVTQLVELRGSQEIDRRPVVLKDGCPL